MIRANYSIDNDYTKDKMHITIKIKYATLRGKHLKEVEPLVKKFVDDLYNEFAGT